MNAGLALAVVQRILTGLVSTQSSETATAGDRDISLSARKCVRWKEVRDFSKPGAGMEAKEPE